MAQRAVPELHDVIAAPSPAPALAAGGRGDDLAGLDSPMVPQADVPPVGGAKLKRKGSKGKKGKAAKAVKKAAVVAALSDGVVEGAPVPPRPRPKKKKSSKKKSGKNPSGKGEPAGADGGADGGVDGGHAGVIDAAPPPLLPPPAPLAQYVERLAHAALLRFGERVAAGHSGATTINAATRGFLVRRRLAAEAAERAEQAEAVRRRRAAVAIQSAMRGCMARVAHARLLARRKAAATRIQARARGILARKRVAQLHRWNAAVMVQRLWRAHRARQAVLMLRNERLRIKLNHHATIIQAACRSHLARLEFRRRYTAQMVCVCNRLPFGEMISCADCFEYFHVGCVGLAPGEASRRQAAGGRPWLCADCAGLHVAPVTVRVRGGAITARAAAAAAASAKHSCESAAAAAAVGSDALVLVSALHTADADNLAQITANAPLAQAPLGEARQLSDPIGTSAGDANVPPTAPSDRVPPSPGIRALLEASRQRTAGASVTGARLDAQLRAIDDSRRGVGQAAPANVRAAGNAGDAGASGSLARARGPSPRRANASLRPAGGGSARRGGGGGHGGVAGLAPAPPSQPRSSGGSGSPRSRSLSRESSFSGSGKAGKAASAAGSRASGEGARASRASKASSKVSRASSKASRRSAKAASASTSSKVPSKAGSTKSVKKRRAKKKAAAVSVLAAAPAVQAAA